MTYNLLILRHAQRELSELPQAIYVRVKVAIYKLADNPRPRGSRKLIGRDGWRVRLGEYWIVYQINNDNRTLTVLHVGHRRDVYR